MDSMFAPNTSDLQQQQLQHPQHQQQQAQHHQLAPQQQQQQHHQQQQQPGVGPGGQNHHHGSSNSINSQQPPHPVAGGGPRPQGRSPAKAQRTHLAQQKQHLQQLQQQHQKQQQQQQLHQHQHQHQQQQQQHQAMPSTGPVGGSYVVPATSSSNTFNPKHLPSGSETDVSTSTENLTQEEQYFLRHMEREEPQGEENGHPDLHQFHRAAAAAAAGGPGGPGGGGAHLNSFNPNAVMPGTLTAALPDQQPMIAGSIQQQQLLLRQQQLRPGAPGGTPTIATPTSYGAALTAAPVSLHRPPGIVDSPTVSAGYLLQGHGHGLAAGVGVSGLDPAGVAVSSSLMRQQDELWAAKLAAARLSAGAPSSSTSLALSPTPSTASISSSGKLNPSVYSSHPSGADPLLRRSPVIPVLGGKKANVDMTSSGAFFDPKGVATKSAANKPNSDIMSKLAREMNIQLASPLGVSTSGLGGSSDISSLGGSNPTLNQSGISSTSSVSAKLLMNPSGTSTGPLGSNSPAKVAAGTRHSNSSGYKSDASDLGTKTESSSSLERLSVPTTAPPTASAAPGSSGSSAAAAAAAAAANRAKKAPSNLTILSRSQPDLFHALEGINGRAAAAAEMSGTSSLKPDPNATPTNQPASASMTTAPSGVGAAASTLYALSKTSPHLMSVSNPNLSADQGKVLETLSRENADLRTELSELTKKVSKVSVLEQEMSKIHTAYQNLLKHSEKREALEKAARQKLQNVIINLTEVNKEVTDRHNAVMAELMSGDPKNQNIPGLDAILRGEIVRKDALIAQLMNQNKMLMANKERLDMEVAAQQETLEEQRSHIQILDSALANANTQVLRLEEENRLKEGYADRVKQMTRSLEQLQAASEKREAMEKKLRAKLEEELNEYRELEERRLREGSEEAKQKGENGTGATSEEDESRREASNAAMKEEVEIFRRKFHEAEERIIRLESERTQWEQRYLEESAMRQVAIDAASFPRDARIAALEQNSAESEKVIAEARADRMKQFEEVQNSQRKISELENVIKTLETSLTEHSAMVRILQSQGAHPAAPPLTPTSFLAHPKQLSTPADMLRRPRTPGSELHRPLALRASGVAGALQLTPRELLARAGAGVGSAGGAPGPEPLLSRSTTPTAEHMMHLRRAAASPGTAVDLLSASPARRDSAPGDVLAHSLAKASPGPAALSPFQHQHMMSLTGSALITPGDLYPSPVVPPQVSAAAAAAVAAHHHLNSATASSVALAGLGVNNTMPKISIAALRDSPINKSTQKYQGVSNAQVSPRGGSPVPPRKIHPALAALATSPQASSFMDDSIDSISGPLSSTTIGGGGNASAVNAAGPGQPGSKTFMEVWRV